MRVGMERGGGSVGRGCGLNGDGWGQGGAVDGCSGLGSV
jgi:hypothetical protein